MKSQNCIDTIATPTTPPQLRLPAWAGRVMHVLFSWVERSRQRRQLAALNDAALKDIGLSRLDVQIEIEKPFWTP
ncbi:MAG: DUF1127 domain-containing protein [Pseudomonadota bacterium]